MQVKVSLNFRIDTTALNLSTHNYVCYGFLGALKNSPVVRVKLSAAENARPYPLISYEWNTLLENCTFYRCKKHNEQLSDINIRPAVQVC